MHAMLLFSSLLFSSPLFSSPLLQFAARLPPLLLLLVSEHPPENLTRGTLGNNINKLNTARNPLVLRLVVLNVFLDLSCKHPIVFLNSYRGRLDNESFGDLSGPLVGYLDNGAVVYRRVGEEVGFKLGRCDLVPLEMVSWVGTQMLLRIIHTFTLMSSFILSTMKMCSFPAGLLRMTASSPVRM